MEKSEITLRGTEPDDAPYLKSWLLDEDTLRWFPMFDEREVDDAVRIWVGYGKQESAITACYKGVPCGMATLYIQPYEKLRHQCLFSIIVDKEHRGMGVGRILLQHLMKMGKEKFHLEILHLEVYEGNPAVKLYRRMGFKPFGRQKHFIKNNGKYAGKIFMQRNL